MGDWKPAEGSEVPSFDDCSRRLFETGLVKESLSLRIDFSSAKSRGTFFMLPQGGWLETGGQAGVVRLVKVLCHALGCIRH
jgi:hypothetical protein